MECGGHMKRHGIGSILEGQTSTKESSPWVHSIANVNSKSASPLENYNRSETLLALVIGVSEPGREIAPFFKVDEQSSLWATHSLWPARKCWQSTDPLPSVQLCSSISKSWISGKIPIVDGTHGGRTTLCGRGNMDFPSSQVWLRTL